jgi:hypothetical protein
MHLYGKKNQTQSLDAEEDLRWNMLITKFYKHY